MENKDLEKKKLKTLKVAEEIVDTEVQYVEKLNVLFINFYKHAKVLLEAKKEVMSEREIAEIFMNIEDIYKLNNNLCTKLVGLRYKGDEMFISGIIETLLTFTPFLKIYTNYTDKYHKATETLQNLQKNPAFAEWVKINEAIVGEDLGSLLIRPVQRIPRYILLMKELLKRLQENIDNLERMAHAINRNAKNTEARERVVLVQQSLFKGNIEIIEPHRVVVAMGKLPVKEKSSLFKTKIIEYLFVLFNDMLLVGQPETKKAKHFKPLHAIPLQLVQVVPMVEGSEEEISCGFGITVNDTSFKIIEVVSKDKETRAKWMRNIRFKKNEFLTDTNLIAKKDLTIKELEAKVFKMGKPPSSTATSKESQQGDSANSKLSKSSVGTTNAAEPTLSEKTT